MLSEEELINATDEIRDVIEKYTKKPLDALLIVQYVSWLTDSSVLTGYMTSLFDMEMKKSVKVKVE